MELMDFVEEMVVNTCMSVFGTTQFEIEGNTINFKSPWKRLPMVDALKEKTGIDVLEADEETLRAELKKHGVELEKGAGKGKLIDEIFGVKCELLFSV